MKTWNITPDHCFKKWHGLTMRGVRKLYVFLIFNLLYNKIIKNIKVIKSTLIILLEKFKIQLKKFIKKKTSTMILY